MVNRKINIEGLPSSYVNSHTCSNLYSVVLVGALRKAEALTSFIIDYLFKDLCITTALDDKNVYFQSRR